MRDIIKGLTPSRTVLPPQLVHLVQSTHLLCLSLQPATPPKCAVAAIVPWTDQPSDGM
ncbi:hypothetical protein IQ06DRAFT_298491 [Phaeosphaeriaceae sp. SRC1lsM3a]|nr:hypothetical protein IQ06DRAFT_298491 [Stagonospora sp. SRC1lsM3a]